MSALTCVGMCIDVCVDECIDVCVDVCIDVRVDMCIDVCVDMCMDMCANMPIGQARRRSPCCHTRSCAAGCTQTGGSHPCVNMRARMLKMCIRMRIDMCASVCMGTDKEVMTMYVRFSCFADECTDMCLYMCVYRRALCIDMHADFRAEVENARHSCGPWSACLDWRPSAACLVCGHRRTGGSLERFSL